MGATPSSSRRTSVANVGLYAASARAVRGPGLRLPVLAALLLLAAIPVVAESYTAQMLPAVTVVLAFALQSALDDPERSILAAAPCSLARRSLTRVAAVTLRVVPLWVAAATLVRRRVGTVPFDALGLQALTIWTVGVAVAVWVWRASGATTPSYVAAPVLLGMVLVGHVLPARWQVFEAQPWGPPWVAAQLRWCALLLVGTASLVLLLADDMDRRPRATPARRRTRVGAPLT
jgi:hypothetical protein